MVNFRKFIILSGMLLLILLSAVLSPVSQATANFISRTAKPGSGYSVWIPLIQSQNNGTGNSLVTGTTPAPIQTGSLTKTDLSKGPELLYTGKNTEMKVFWQWNSNVSFHLDWGTDSNFSGGTVTVNAYDTTNHLYATTISGLTPGQKYNYRVVTGSQYTDGSFFAAPKDSATTLKFFSYGDTRTNASQHDAVAAQVVAQAKADPAYQTFNLDVGDLVANGDTESMWMSELYSTSLKHIREEMANIAVLPVMGNHEASGNLFKRYFPLPFVSSRYWSFDYGPAHVVMLDQFTAYNAGSAQYNWMKADLAATTKKWKIVVLHMPGWTANGGHPNDATTQNDLEPIFEQNQVALVLGGHNHYYARAMVNGIAHLTVGTGGAPHYAPASGQPNIVSTYEGLGYAKFEINGSSMTGWFVSNDGVVRDTFSLTR